MSIEDLTTQKGIFDSGIEEGHHFTDTQADSISVFMEKVIEVLTAQEATNTALAASIRDLTERVKALED